MRHILSDLSHFDFDDHDDLHALARKLGDDQIQKMWSMVADGVYTKADRVVRQMDAGVYRAPVRLGCFQVAAGHRRLHSA